MQRRSALWALAEILTMAALLISYIWWWGYTFDGSFRVCVILYIGLGAAAHLRAGEGLADIGLRFDTLGASGRAALLATVPIGLLLMGAGGLLGSLHFPPLPVWPEALRTGIVWGALQQYGLLAIFYRRFC